MSDAKEHGDKDSFKKEEQLRNQKEISKTWILNPWNLISTFIMYFLPTNLRACKVFPKMVQPFRKIIINGDVSKQPKRHIDLKTDKAKVKFSEIETESTRPNCNKLESSPGLNYGGRKLFERNENSYSSNNQPNEKHDSNAIAAHYNKMQSFERSESKIFHLLCFNNWIKSMLLSEYINKIIQNQKPDEPLRVLDMCCGKGGDLLKYEKQKISHLICTDFAKVSLEKCKSRYKRVTNCFSAEFFVSDCSRDRLKNFYKSPWLEHNLVCCQFALHYSFETYSQANCFISNASECLKSGSYFIATIPNAYEIMRRLKNSVDGRSFGNDVYNIEALFDAKRPPLFGAKYIFQLEGVANCPEYLIHFPTLIKLCRKNGLKLENVNTFAEYYKASFQKGESLLKKTDGLQSFVYEKDSPIDEDYTHVENFVNETESNSDCYGTLSQKEWQVASVLSWFSFCGKLWSAFNLAELATHIKSMLLEPGSRYKVCYMHSVLILLHYRYIPIFDQINLFSKC